jgi:predicted Rossmann-fold nucleotide-binding protein
MGGHAMLRSDSQYRDIALTSKLLTERGFLLLSGGGPGAMEATHLGAWMAGREAEELDRAIEILSAASSYKDREWLSLSFKVMERYPRQESFRSVGIPTWFYGHEPATPFASHIAKYFDNSIREDGLLALAKGGVIYSPGSAGTMQEIFQDAAQNHYLTFDFSSPMIFFGEEYWQRTMPIYELLQSLQEQGRYRNLKLMLTDSAEAVVHRIEEFCISGQ